MNLFLPAAVLISGAIVARSINRSSTKMSAALDRLVAEVADVRGVAASAVAALSAIPQLIRDAIANANGDTDAKLNELADDLESSIAPLAGALSQNPGPTDPGGDTQSAPVGADETAAAGAGADSGVAADDAAAALAEEDPNA